jgi:hypothetical protein
VPRAFRMVNCGLTRLVGGIRRVALVTVTSIRYFPAGRVCRANRIVLRPPGRKDPEARRDSLRG